MPVALHLRKAIISLITLLLCAVLPLSWLTACDSTTEITIVLDEGSEVSLTDIFSSAHLSTATNTQDYNVAALAGQSMQYGSYTELALDFDLTSIATNFLSGMLFKLKAAEFGTYNFELRVREVEEHESIKEWLDEITGELKSETEKVEIITNVVLDTFSIDFNKDEEIIVICEGLSHSILANTVYLVCTDNSEDNLSMRWSISELQICVSERELF
jgi:hypothetical protein